MPTIGILLGQAVYEALLDGSSERWRRSLVLFELYRLFSPAPPTEEMEPVRAIFERCAAEPGFRLCDEEVLVLSVAARKLFEDHARGASGDAAAQKNGPASGRGSVPTDRGLVYLEPL
jgi:hypothetical protein